MDFNKAYLANGCFWCSEAVFQELKGVKEVISGYSGGDLENPTYEEVSEGDTNHAETIEITYDPNIIEYKTLVKIFFLTHNPTTLNRQGNDIGTQYRSAIFYQNEDEKNIALEVKKEIEDEKIYEDPIVTEITEFKKFYKAEDYHQEFFKNNPNYGYCQVIINPKVQKLRKEFSELINN